MVQRDPPFERQTLGVVRVIHGPQISATQQGGQLGRIDPVVLVAVGGDQPIPSRVADHQRIDAILEVAIQPAGERPLLERQVLGARNPIEHFPNRPDAGRQRVPLNDPPFAFDAQFYIVAMHVRSNIMVDHDAIPFD